MTEILALVGAVVLVILVQMLRGLLALPFARERASFVPATAPNGTAPLFDEATQVLGTLGFTGPRWVMTARVDGEPSGLPLRAVYVHTDGSVVAAGPPINAAYPHRLHGYFASRLQDGRVAISQAFDPYFEATQTDEIVARTAVESGWAAQLAAHQAWVAGLGSTIVVMDDSGLLDLFGGLMDRQRQALITRGALRAVSDHLAVPRPLFALRILRAVRAMPRSAPDPRPVPAERLVLLARNRELMQQRSPPRDVQWLLFAVSVALFMALGALFWGPQFALFILVVVLIHELGHFLAMRAFGYRNVHLMALPLVGGVAMGYDANPSATRRAWMSLMGPLPGIIIGWLLLLATMFGPLSAHTVWISTLAMIFLFINYLNVLPVPPLDGAHVVTCLLPPRWARVEAVFLAVAAIIGGLLAWQYGLPILTALAALQLTRVPMLWRQHGVERDLAVDVSLPGAHRGLRMLRIMRELEQRLGPTRNAGERITLGLSVLLRLDTRPMGAVSRLLTGTVYLGLLAVPVAVMVFSTSLLTGVARDTAAAEQQMARWNAEQTALLDSAHRRTLDQLLQNPDIATAIAPASAEAIANAERRLGQPLPAELRAVYQTSNGAPHLGLLPVESIQPAAEVIDKTLAPYLEQLLLEVGDTADFTAVEIPLRDARSWWHLGGEAEDAPLFYLPEGDARLPDQHVINYFIESPESFANLRDWLESRWVMAEQQRRMDAKFQRDAKATQRLRVD